MNRGTKPEASSELLRSAEMGLVVHRRDGAGPDPAGVHLPP